MSATVISIKHFIADLLTLSVEENFGFSHCLRFPRCKYIFWDATSRRETDNPEGDGEIHDMWHCVSLTLLHITRAGLTKSFSRWRNRQVLMVSSLCISSCSGSSLTDSLLFYSQTPTRSWKVIRARIRNESSEIISPRDARSSDELEVVEL